MPILYPVVFLVFHIEWKWIGLVHEVL